MPSGSRGFRGAASSGGGGGGGGTVLLGPDYGDGRDLTAGAAVGLGSLAVGPADVGVGASIDLWSLEAGPYTQLAAGAAADLSSLSLGPLAAPSVGMSVAGTLVVDGMESSDDTYLDNQAPSTTNGGANPLLARLPNALGNNEKIAYLMWDLTGIAGTITSASIDLVMQTTAGSPENAPVQVYTHTSKPFDEDTSTWNSSEPPAGTLRQSSTLSAPTSFATRNLVLGSGVRANMAGNWLYLRIRGVTSLGLETIHVRPKEAPGAAPKLDMEIAL